MCSESTSIGPARTVEAVVGLSISACQSRPVTSRMSCSRLLASSSGAKVRKFVGLRRVTSRSQRAEHPGRLVLVRPAARPSTPYSRQSGSRRSRAAHRRSRPGWRSSGVSRGASSSSSATGRPLSSKSSSGGRAAATPPGRGGAPRWPRAWGSGTWWARKVPSTCWPSTIGGHVQPFGVRSTIIGHRRPGGRVAGLAAAAGSRAIRPGSGPARPPSPGAPRPGRPRPTTCGSYP